ncbi:exopolysaccharide biosynthesis polyprenyl glycosylphosphotransferase [Streptomyces sp. NBC_00083]|uniref:exopolysaccharide biosynthesis polyprenyl glycosylphosphotransferase n=1 Tax=Streptomyces sp. NBC_00083 TaxID=2975647 RepID=UPI00225C4051|nr:exopolysaccharide biosynthesis polyprenyl glycosylphosphotransferase [Streptomyces sp. NBC_00083]MCX5381768.1 exopolysaccharide biosynthesis polyprenyl glycosylphosphotransferase [Streptomyces sp. NBC_00083]
MSTGTVSVVTPREAPDHFVHPAGRPRTGGTFVSVLLAVDCAAGLLGMLALPYSGLPPGPAGLLVATVLLLNAQAGLYRPVMAGGVLGDVPALFVRALTGWCVLAAVLTHQNALAREAGDVPLAVSAVAAGCAVQTVASCAGRGAALWLRRRKAARRPRPALVVGPAATAVRVTAALVRQSGGGVRPVGVVVPPSETPVEAGPVPVLRSLEEVQRAVIQNGVRDCLFTYAVEAAGPTPASPALLEAMGCALWQLDTRAPGHTVPGGQADEVAAFPCSPLTSTPAGAVGLFLKRLLDLALTVPALIAASPVLLVCAVLLRRSDGPGVLFRQERVGVRGTPFTLLKFRTLRPDTVHEAATRWNIADDHRMSRAGHFMRRTSLDELPQLWNVIRGDMSLVGPRPERPYFVAQFSSAHPGYAARHRMPVGLTGLAQVEGLRGDTSIEDRARYDNYYIDHWSLWRDLCILLRTAACLVRPTGS